MNRFDNMPWPNKKQRRPPPETTGLDHLVRLRTIRPTDLPFLLDLHAGFRAEELAPVLWPKAAKDDFLADQYRLQQQHLVTRHPEADFWLVLRAEGSTAVGRLYLDRSTPLWRVLDIGFVPEARGGGIGTALLGWVQARARAAGAEGVDLHVLTTNPRARALYLRHGFQDEDAPKGFHQLMVWRTA